MSPRRGHETERLPPQSRGRLQSLGSRSARQRPARDYACYVEEPATPTRDFEPPPSEQSWFCQLRERSQAQTHVRRQRGLQAIDCFIFSTMSMSMLFLSLPAYSYCILVVRIVCRSMPTTMRKLSQASQFRRTGFANHRAFLQRGPKIRPALVERLAEPYLRFLNLGSLHKPRKACKAARLVDDISLARC